MYTESEYLRRTSLTPGGTLIVLVQPDSQTFPCQLMACHVLRSAEEARKERIRVEKPGHTCEFGVAQLRRFVDREMVGQKSLVRAGTMASHRAFGNEFEERIQVWPGVDLSRSFATEG